MGSIAKFFEIPAIDFQRAKGFYQSILDIEIEEVDMDGALTGFFPDDGSGVSGAIVKGDGYEPSQAGVLVYLSGGEDLQKILDKVVSAGGKVTLEKTMIGPEQGFYATFIDSEGSKIALHSDG